MQCSGRGWGGQQSTAQLAPLPLLELSSVSVQLSKRRSRREMEVYGERRRAEVKSPSPSATAAPPHVQSSADIFASSLQLRPGEAGRESERKDGQGGEGYVDCGVASRCVL